MNMPIILIHRGDDEYLHYSLQQAKVSNPDSPVILIGKPGNKKYCIGDIKHEFIDHYMQSAAAFAKVYKHVNHPIAYEYILFCFQRWYILRDYMWRNRLQKCCYVDSDVMLYTRLNRPEFSRLTFEFTWTNIVSLESIERFCHLTTQYFSDMTMFQQLVKYTKETTPYGVNDMVLSELYLRHYPNDKYRHGFFEGSFFDENINVPIRIGREHEAFETWDAKKKIYCINGEVYSRKLEGGEFLKANSLHFWGPCKQYMKYFYSPTVSGLQGTYYFNYPSNQWLPA